MTDTKKPSRARPRQEQLIAPERLREQRLAMRLAVKDAAALIAVKPRTWQRFESPVNSPSHRPIDATQLLAWTLQCEIVTYVRQGGVWPPKPPLSGRLPGVA